MNSQLNPIMAQMLKPFAPKPTENNTLRVALEFERANMAKLLREPFEIEVDGKTFNADPGIVWQAVDEFIERNVDAIECRVVELTKARNNEPVEYVP